MVAQALEPPAFDFATIALSLAEIHPLKLLRVSRYNSGEPYFGLSGGNRFDDPNNLYGTCYFGTKLSVAIAETLLHDEVPKAGKFEIASDTLENRYVIRTDGEPLRLANLTGAPLKRLGGHADLSATVSYAVTQHWSLAVHDHPDNVDGFVYMSRHLNTDKAVVLFDRAKSKISMLNATPLLDVKGFAYAARILGIKGI